MTAGADVDALEQLLDGALDEFDCVSTERNGQQEHAPGIPAAEGEIDPQEQRNAVDDKRVSSGPGKGPKFNPLGRKPKKKRAPDIDDLRNVSPEEVEESTKELSTMLQNMMKENQPVPAAATSAAPSDGAASYLSTLDQINEAARKAAEKSTGSWSNPNLAQAGGGDEMPDVDAQEMQKMLDAMQGAMGGAGGDMDSFVDTLMHGILCKEVLYEPLKDVGERYPKWLKDNEGKISAEELEQHKAQLAHINAICKLLDEHGNDKFDDLLRLLQELQAMGQPPQELLAEMQAANASSMNDGGAGGLPTQCPVQ